ncbi:MAG: hypothetical protein E6H00_14710 [Bacillati bacterium ANGP1]|uniref:Uncharacterized protein n=1 Tax=Candidatus Segetimicrobium genomatis TaxID=2569760 RepID=A0A537JW78_9BACT|nr:MAG: hypothetical protein E6H00_14710 [Terrabacteria group bacterium ANGP1]
MPTKLQHAVARCESYLRDHPDATVAEAITALWDSFGLDRNDVLPHMQIWFPDDTQETIQRAIVRQVWVAAFTEASQLPPARPSWRARA